ncbi:MAG: glycosyltransferase family 4 protein [Dysgonamonadaceae bacterium]|nr:glycosyltransferase family 4 protein [Dysgonamonadaceae bacterium]
MQQKRKILFIHHATGWGGATLSMIKAIERLDQSKFSVEVLLIKNSDISKILHAKGIKYHIAKNEFYKKYYNYFSHASGGHKWYHLFTLLVVSASWILSRFYFSRIELKNIECDIIHLNSSALTDWLYASSKKATTIIHFREALADGYLGIRKSFFRKQVKKYADHIIAISKDNAARLNLPEKTTVIYNYTEIKPDIENLKNQPQKMVLYVGGAQIIKGYFTMVDALDYLNEDITVCFCGYYPDKLSFNVYDKIFLHRQNNKMIASLEKMRKHKNARIIGLIEDISPFLSDTDALISPFSKEHFSRPVIEAFAHKKPAIGSNVVGMEELIDNKINGLIVEKDNPKALADAINYICTHPVVAKKMGDNGYQKAKALFSPKNVKQIEKVYESLANDN